MVKMLFNPAIRIINRLKFLQKLLLVGLLLLVPTIVTTYFLTSEINQEVRLEENKTLGIQYSDSLMRLLQHTQDHRGFANMYLSGHQAYREKIVSTQGKIAAQITQIDLLNQEDADAFGIARQWNELKEEIDHIRGYVFEMTAAESFKIHTDLTAGIINLLTTAGYASGLNQDPRPSARYLAEALIRIVPSLTEYQGQLRSSGSAVLARGGFADEAERYSFISRTITAKYLLQELERGITVITQAEGIDWTELEKMGLDTMKSTTEYLNLIEKEIILAEQPALNPEKYFAAATQAIELLFGFIDTMEAFQEEQVLLRLDQLNSQKREIIILIAAVLLFSSYFFVGFNLATMRTITTLQNKVLDLAGGDLRTRVQLETRDELSIIGRAINQLAENFGDIIRGNQQAAQQTVASSQQLAASGSQVNEAARQVGDTTQELAEGAEEQAARISDTASSIEALAKQIDLVNSKAQAISQAGQSVIKTVGAGTDSVVKAEEQMTQINTRVGNAAANVQALGKKSGEVGKILDLIRGIAGQTNLLALNAAIEAARAGEHGRGFAVVAEEVRKLAEETTAATGRIGELVKEIQTGIAGTVATINESTGAVENGVVIIAATGEAFSKINSVTKELMQLIAQIVDGTEEMAASGSQAGKTIMDIAAISQEFAKSVQEVAASSQEQVSIAEEMASAARQLAAMAEQLSHSVARFKL
jgi:methyl-accepting chemotaxis protein